MFQTDLERAERFLSDRCVEQAEEICQSVLEERPDHVRALRIMAEIRLAANKLEDAERFITAALELDPEDPKLQNQLGRLSNNYGQLDQAECAFRRALELNPNFADAYNNLGHVLRRKGYSDAAEQCFRDALARDPDHSAANLNLGAAYFEQKRLRKAIHLLEKGLKENEVDTVGRYNLALAYQQVGRFDEAIYTYRQLVAAGSAGPDAYSNLASALQATGDLEGAVCGFLSALELKADHAPSLAGIAGLMDLIGDYERGIEILAPFLKRGRATPMMHVAFAQLLRRLGRSRQALRHVAPLASANGLDRQEKMAVMFLIGDLLDEMGEYERAFVAYRKANQCASARYCQATRERAVAQLIETFSKTRLATMPRSGRETELPVFIVGMPRSGTSLVEQILASHSRIYGRGELGDIALIAERLGRKSGAAYPECLLEMSEDDLRSCSGEYIRKLRRNLPWPLRVTDKMWQNFEHLGLIELMYPCARVIHCIRDPRDTGLSCYQQSFGTSSPPFSFDLADIGHYYGQYRRLMEHWREVGGLRVMEVTYEDLVADVESQSRRLVDFLGLSWEDDCLRFFENPRPVRTASHAQVRRPVYNTSVGRWRHYQEQLTPLIDSLVQGGFIEN